MASFQKTLIIVAFIVLILALLFIGILVKNTTKKKWPPVVPECPDWWKATKDPSGNIICKNIQNLGTCSSDFNPNNSQYTGSSGACNKYNWANSFVISWDGVNYGVDNPCTTSS